MVTSEATNEMRESGPGYSLETSGLPLIKLYPLSEKLTLDIFID
jgi:hypothetical protein